MKLSSITIGLVASLACAVLHAQGTDLVATVPFDFQMGQKVMPAGKYRIMDRSNGVIAVREEGGKFTTQMFLTSPISRHNEQTTGSLQFTRYGDTYFLSNVWSPNSRSGRAFPKTPEEKELASRAGPAHTADVALARK